MALTITQQPRSQAVYAGQTAVFVAAATSTSPPVSFVWVINGVITANQTAATLTLTNLNQSQDGATVQCNFSDAAGNTAQSQVAELTVKDAPLAKSLAWVVVDPTQVETFMQSFVNDAVNPLDASGQLRAANMVGFLANRFRGAIVRGNRVPLSLTANSIPSEAQWHLLVLLAEGMAASVPQVAEFVQGPRFGAMVDDAKDWLRMVGEGILVPVAPPDPDATTQPAGPTWGDMYQQEAAGVAGKIDVTTDGPFSTGAPPL